MSPFSRRAAAPVSAVLVGASVALTFPWLWGQHVGAAWFDGDVARADALARGVEASLENGDGHFQTGSERFDGEWWFGTFQMAALGFGHLALQHADHRVVHLAQMEKALDRLRAPGVDGFDSAAWGESPWDGLAGANDHAAFYGYTALPYALHRKLAPGTAYDVVEQQLIDALTWRFETHGVLETYPGERYPIDNSAGIGALGLHDAATGQDHAALIAGWGHVARERFVDPATGLFVQSVAADLSVVDGPRGSGTGLASYFLSWADPALSRDLWAAQRRELYGGGLGFGAMREYPRGVFGLGDIDSGPVIFGFGVSSTGFALSSARRHGDRDAFCALYATTHVFGAPTAVGDATRFATGGPIGDAILFAMLTAPAEGR